MSTAVEGGAPQQRYELVSTLGKGGMAEVFLGWMHSVGGLKRKVAIKRILPDLVQKQSRLFEKMFVDEARLAFQLEHDCVVRVYDVGQSANTFFIVMEYVEGMDLKAVYDKLTERGERMAIGEAAYVAAQVAAGLAYANDLSDENGHHMGLVHNDISPPNILCGRHGEVKIADFGLSDARSNDVVTPDGMVKGKFAYISPESTRDPSTVGHRSDVFSTGIVLWELLAGARLFQKDTDLETFQAVRDARVPDIRTVRPDVPAELAAIVHKALAGNPDDRHQSAVELYNDLSTVSYKLNIPLNRFALVNLINRLTDKEWGGFAGSQVSEEQVNMVNAELEGMLPPGVAAHLKTFVTGARVETDVEDSALIQSEDWVGDVFGDVGFDDADLSTGFDEQIGTAPAPAPEPSPISAPSLPPKPPPVQTASAPAPAPPTPTPAPSKPAQPMTPPAANTLTTDSMMAAMKTEIDNQRVTWIVWGTIAGLVIGAGLGFAIGALL